MMKTEEKELLDPACDIKGYCHDDLVQMMDYFPVPVFLPEKEEEEKEMECVRGLCGIWYAVKKYDEDEWLEWKDNCSFLDAEGNFYCSIEKTELDDEDRKSLRKFVALFGRELEDVRKGTLPYLEFTYILNACRDRCRGGDVSFLTKKIHDSVIQLSQSSFLSKAESGLPVNIRLDVLGGYRMNDFTTDAAKRIWFQNNTEDEYQIKNGYYQEINHTLATTNIRPDFYKYELKLNRKERSEIRALIENNKLLLSTLCDTLDTGVDISFFHENFIKGPLMRPEKERREIEKKVRARVMAWRAKKHFKEYYRYSDTYYRQTRISL